MHKIGISVSNGTNIVIQNYIVFQIIFMLYSCLAIILNNTLHLFVKSPLLTNFTIIGFIANFISSELTKIWTYSTLGNFFIQAIFTYTLHLLKVIEDYEAKYGNNK